MSPEMTYADFERLLAVYGSDRARWPVEARKAAAQLVAQSADARQLLVEAEALDRLLDRAPLPTLSREAALSARIVEAAQRTPRVVATRGGAVAIEEAAPSYMPGRAGTSPLAARLSIAGRSGWRFATSKAGLGAMLSAASLAAGVLIGLTNTSQSVLRPVQQLAGFALSGSSQSVVQFDPLEEDLL